MILYHGTNCDFSEIDLNQTKPYKDFGQGFYLTDIQDQALAKELEFKDLNSQYCFLTKKAIACLIRIK